MIATVEQVASLVSLAGRGGSQARAARDLQQRWERLQSEPLEFVASTAFAQLSPGDTNTLAVRQALRGDCRVTSERRVSTLARGAPLAVACELPLLSGEQEQALFARMNHVKYLAHGELANQDNQPPSKATIEQVESWLAEALQIRNCLVGANVRLVISIVKTYADIRNPFDELVSEALLSMMHAVEKFDYQRGFRFSTYATRAIRRNLYRLLLDRQKERMRCSTAGETSWEVAAEQSVSAISERRWEELQSHLQSMLQQLDLRERQVIVARFGMGQTGRVQTLQSLAHSLGVCKERVRQIEKRAIDKLQKMVHDIQLEDPTAELAS